MKCEECIYPDEFQLLCRQGRTQFVKDFAECEYYEPVKKSDKELSDENKKEL